MKFDAEVDLIAIGSGAAGLSAALTAARLGGQALVLEATDKLGGTTAFSGALLWVPFNRWQRAKGIDDSREVAEAYVRKCLGERAGDPRWKTFFDTINLLVEELLEKECGLRFALTRYPDSYGEWEEGRTSRHINARAYPMARLREWQKHIRKPMVEVASMMTLLDIERAGWVRPAQFPGMLKIAPALFLNKIANRRGMGVGLVAALLDACLRRSVRFELGARVVELLREGTKVNGVLVEQNGKRRPIRARRGVVLACGGFSADKLAREKFLRGPYALPQEPPVNCGDNLRLAAQVDADLRGLDEAWYLPSAMLPGEYMGEALGRPLVCDRMLPHQIWVNRAGRRFVNEAGQNAAEAFYVKDSAGARINYPCFSLFDQQYRDRFPIYIAYTKNSAGPPELVTAATLAELAGALGIDPVSMQASVARYNELARGGRDHDFGRGDGAYERYFVGTSGNLGTIEKAPFYALPVHSGGVGTKGGPMTTASGQVLSRTGDVVPGLYAAGNAAAAFNGPITVAAGCTITPALVMGHASATAALAGSSRLR